MCISSEKVTDKTPISIPDWEALIGQIADDIMAERSPARILQVRAKLYDLLTHCIPPTTILKTLAFKLIPKIDDALKADVIKWAAFYEHRIRMGSVSGRRINRRTLNLLSFPPPSPTSQSGVRRSKVEPVLY